ncbi:hypothetical protein [Streptomyces sp. NPDC002402]
MTIKVKYRHGVLSASEIEGIVKELIADADQDSDLRREVRERGLEPSDLKEPETFGASQAESGVDIVELIVYLSGPAVYDVWKYVLLPRITQRFGVDAVGDEIERDDDSRDQ